MRKTVQLLSLLLVGSLLSAQQMNTKAAPEPAPIPASASETHAAAAPVYPTPQYYNDVIIQSNPSIDQRHVRLSVAFNGWLYAAFSTYDSTLNKGGITITMSRDNGQSWTQMDSYSVTDVRYSSLDIVVCGTDTNSLTLYLAGINNNTATGNFILFVDRYNATTGAFIGSNFNQNAGTRPIYDVALASDYMNPAVNATPYSVGMLYSTYSSSLDSIVFLGSVDGGASWTVRQNVATTGGYNRKVSIAYGRSASASNGRYFGAWEQLGASSARTGHIYSAHSLSTVDGGWNVPVNLDSISSTMINLCRNPQIAVQYNSTDNDSGSCTAVVLVDRDYVGDGSDYDMLGFYNKRAHYTNFWYRLDIMNSGENDMQADVTYDPTNNNFLAVYYDSTNGKLPYIVNNFNLVTPSTWTTITTQYNDASNLKAAYPRVEINPVTVQAAHVWNAEGTLGRGVSMFDAEYVIAGVETNNAPRGGNTIMAFPNPAADAVNISYVSSEDAVMNVYSASGALIETRAVSASADGRTETLNVGEWANGIYIVEIASGTQRQTSRIVVSHQ